MLLAGAADAYLYTEYGDLVKNKELRNIFSMDFPESVSHALFFFFLTLEPPTAPQRRYFLWWLTSQVCDKGVELRDTGCSLPVFFTFVSWCLTSQL